jgi:hypothetical protein
MRGHSKLLGWLHNTSEIAWDYWPERETDDQRRGAERREKAAISRHWAEMSPEEAERLAADVAASEERRLQQLNDWADKGRTRER